MPAERKDVHQKITDQIIAMLETASGSFELPWHRTGGASMRPINVASQKPYRGINILTLWSASHAHGYESGVWGSYRQWAAKGVQVRKGEKGSYVVFYQEVTSPSPGDDAAPSAPAGDPSSSHRRLITKASAVFAAEQVDGFQTSAPVPRDPVSIIAQAEAFIAATGASISYEGERAYYRPSTDSIHLPPPYMFIGTSTSSPTLAFYSTLLHELTHWTGHPSRCDRQLTNRFGSEAYAMEEFIAELGSAFLCADLGVTPSPRQDHAHYLANWLNVLRNDKRAIFTAASKATQAADYLASLQPTAQSDTIQAPVCLAEAALAAVHQVEVSRTTPRSPHPEHRPACRDC